MLATNVVISLLIYYSIIIYICMEYMLVYSILREKKN